MAEAGEQFDVVLNMEVVEHVADPQGYLTACQELLKPGGLMICSTINRNPKSFAMAIVGAEYVMRWLPKGTHEWEKFITPDELYDLIRNAGLTPVDRKGFVFNPVTWTLAALGPRSVGELRDRLDQAGLTLRPPSSSSRRRISRITGRAWRTRSAPISLIVSDRIGAMAAMAASRARRPAGLIAISLRRASSQSGRTWICPAHSSRFSVLVIAPRVTWKDPRQLRRGLFLVRPGKLVQHRKMAELHALGQRLAQPVARQLVGHEHLAEQRDRKRIVRLLVVRGLGVAC
jgi:hypothetical protein